MTGADNLRIIEAFFDAYNACDTETLHSLLHETVHWEHHNRFKGAGRDGLVKSIVDWNIRAPGRHFGPILRSAGSNDLTYIEHRWSAVIAQPSEEFGWKVGDKVEFDAVSVFVIREGVITEWSDYG